MTQADRQKEAVAFGTHLILQLLYAFDRLDEVSEEAAPGSPKIALYMNSLYHLLAAAFLVDRRGEATGGLFSRVFVPLDMSECLVDVYQALERPVGELTLGEVIRRFRNKVLVHGSLSDVDLGHIYRDVDMSEPAAFEAFQAGLLKVREELPHLAVCLCKAVGIAPEDVGIHLV